MSNSLYYLPYNSYNVSSDDLLLDQLFITKLIFFFILITFLLDIASILYGEILVWSLLGVKGLRDIDSQHHRTRNQNIYIVIVKGDLISNRYL